MNKQPSKIWRNFGRVLLAITVCSLVVYNAAAIYFAISLRSGIRHYRIRQEELEALHAHQEWLKLRVAEVAKQANYDDR
jgi:AraC-like DNA-binding protein